MARRSGGRTELGAVAHRRETYAQQFAFAHPCARALAYFDDHTTNADGPRLIGTLASPQDPEAVTRLPYLDAACSETLRLNPVAPIAGRTLRQGMTLQLGVHSAYFRTMRRGAKLGPVGHEPIEP